MATAAVSHEDYDVDFDEVPSAASTSFPSSISATLAPPSATQPANIPYADAFEKTIVAPASSLPPSLPRRVSFTEGDDFRLTQAQPPIFSTTQPLDASAYTYVASPPITGSPFLQRAQSVPSAADPIPSLSLQSLSRTQSDQPAYLYQPQPSARSPSQLTPPPTAAASSGRAARIQALMSEFDGKFLQTDPVTRRQTYPAWAVPYAREMLDKLEYVRKMERATSLPASSTFRAADEKRRSLTRTQSDTLSEKRPTLHARYDSMLDQYYPDKHDAIHAGVPAKKASTLSSSLKKPIRPPPGRPQSAHSNCVGHAHGRHSMVGTEEPGQKIRVTKLHAAMTEQINLLSGSLREAWEKIEEHETRDDARGVREEVADEVRGMREWREWNRARMGELVAEMQRVMREQEEGQARAAVIQAEQVELRARYDEARTRMDEMRGLHEQEVRAWEERMAGMQGREREGREEEARLRRERDEYERRHGQAQQRLQEMQQRLAQLQAEREMVAAQLAQLKDGADGSRKQLLEQLAALQQQTAALQGKTQALEASHAELSSTHSTLREQHNSLTSTHSTLLNNHQATAALLASYQAELQQAQRAQSDLQAMLKVEGEQVRTWRDQCEALESKLKDAEARAKAKPSARPGQAVVADLVPRLVSAHYKRRVQSITADTQRIEADFRASTSQLAQREAELAHLTSLYQHAAAAHSSQSDELQRQLVAKQSEVDFLHSAHHQHISDLHSQLAAKDSLLLTTDSLNSELAAFVASVKPQLSDLKLSAAVISGFKGDYLNARTDPQVLAMIFTNGDKTVIFADSVVRWDSRGRVQRRWFVLTEKHVYVMKEKSTLGELFRVGGGEGGWKDMRRCIRLAGIQWVGASAAHGRLFVVHVDDKYDYLLESPKRNEVLYWLMKTYETLHEGAKSLRIEWREDLFVRDRGQKYHREIQVVGSEKAQIGRKAILTPAELNEVKK